MNFVYFFLKFGDAAEITYYRESHSPKQLVSTNCSIGGSDTLSGGPGLVDYLVGGTDGDIIHGNEGMDLVFGDHAIIQLYSQSHKLKEASTTEASCGGGSDIIDLGPGDDLVSLQQRTLQEIILLIVI